MGIALGLGVIFGVRAVEGSLLAVVPVVLLLATTAVISRQSVRKLCIFAALGCALGALAGVQTDSDDPTFLAAAPTGMLTGSITSDPHLSPRGATVRFTWHDLEGVERESLLFLPSAPVVGRGDIVEVTGRFDGENGDLLFARNVRLRERAGWIERQRRTVRNYLTTVIQDRVPGTQGALSLGLIIGDDTALTSSERDQLRRAGLSHLTAVSGWNVTLVTSAVGLIMLKLGRRGWGWTAVQFAALSGFVWIVGLDPPVTRAAIMAVAGLVAIRLGRPAHSVTVLTVSAATMVAVSPDALASLSFQLSVLATLGLVLAARLSSNLSGWNAVVLTPIIATGTIGIITAPLLAAEFGTLSLLTVPANIAAAPLVPAATLAGIVTVASSWIGPLAAICGWGAWIVSGAILWLARVMSGVPYGFHEFAPLSDTAQATLYTLILVAIVSILPEGRTAGRHVINWARSEPAGAALTISTACVALLTAALVV